MSLFGLINRWRKRAQGFKKDAYVLYYAYRDPRMPWYARLFVLLVAGYAFSPVDLVPDYIPVLGYLDDLLIIPLGVSLAMKMIPAPVLEDSRHRAAIRLNRRPVFRAGAVLVALFWLLVVGLLLWYIL